MQRDASAGAHSAVVPARPGRGGPSRTSAGPVISFRVGDQRPADDDSIAGAERDAAGRAVLDIRAQTRAVLENIRDILTSAGASLADVVEVSTYLVNMPTSTVTTRSTASSSATRVRRAPPWRSRSCRTRSC